MSEPYLEEAGKLFFNEKGAEDRKEIPQLTWRDMLYVMWQIGHHGTIDAAFPLFGRFRKDILQLGVDFSTHFGLPNGYLTLAQFEDPDQALKDQMAYDFYEVGSAMSQLRGKGSLPCSLFQDTRFALVVYDLAKIDSIFRDIHVDKMLHYYGIVDELAKRCNNSQQPRKEKSQYGRRYANQYKIRREKFAKAWRFALDEANGAVIKDLKKFFWENLTLLISQQHPKMLSASQKKQAWKVMLKLNPPGRISQKRALRT